MCARARYHETFFIHLRVEPPPLRPLAHHNGLNSMSLLTFFTIADLPDMDLAVTLGTYALRDNFPVVSLTNCFSF